MALPPLDFIAGLLERSGPIPGADAAARRGYRYLDAGHINSFEIVPFILEIEEHFGITLTPEDTQSEEFRTLGGLADMIKKKLAASGG